MCIRILTLVLIIYFCNDWFGWNDTALLTVIMLSSLTIAVDLVLGRLK